MFFYSVFIQNKIFSFKEKKRRVISEQERNRNLLTSPCAEKFRSVRWKEKHTLENPNYSFTNFVYIPSLFFLYWNGTKVLILKILQLQEDIFDFSELDKPHELFF